jgi:hypothetical protein
VIDRTSGKRNGKSQASFIVKVGSVTIPVYLNSRDKNGKPHAEFLLAYYDAEGRRVRRSFSDATEARREAERLAAGMSPRPGCGSLSQLRGRRDLFGRRRCAEGHRRKPDCRR